MISRHVPYLLLFVAGCLCITGGACADDAKTPKVTAAEAAAKAAEAEANRAAAVAAAAVEAAAKAATAAAVAKAEAEKAATAAAAAKAAKVPEAQVKKASEQIKKAIEAHQSLDDSLIAALLAAKALPASKKTHEDALQAVIEATAAVNKVREQLKSKITEKEKKPVEDLETALATAQQKYGLARNLLDIADNSYQRSVSDLKKALALAKSTHQTAIAQASKMEALLETIAQQKSDAKKGDQKLPAVPQAKRPAQDIEGPRVEPIDKPSSAARTLPPPTAAEQTAGTPPLPPNPRVREMIPPSTHLWHVDAFRKLPFVQEVKAAQNLGEFDETSTATAVGKSSAPEFVCDYRFDRPAHFPLPEFGLGGETFDDSGLVIYEGMRLAVRPDGRYQVRFVVGTPAVPVEMKLQFILEDQATLQRYTLTLPRVAIPPKKKPAYASQRRDIDPVYQDVQTVHHEGYLPFLGQQSQAFRIVRRTGTARFGFGVDVP